MNYIVRSNVALPKPKAWTVNQSKASEAKRPMRIPTRRAEIQWLDASGHAQSKSAVVPALPAFLGAFSALAQGTLIQTDRGYVAVEDLMPGDKVATAEGTTETVRWIGCVTLLPNAPELNLPEAHLYRVTDGGYGLDPQAPDLLLGPSARVLPGMFAVNSSSPLADIDDLADAGSVIRIRPMSPVRVFHIALANHRLMRANGVLVESFHPGQNVRLHMSTELFEIFLSLFPHLEHEGDFGPQHHRHRVPDYA